MPPRTDEATEPAAAITATPSIRQARKMRKPFSPPRSWRRAKRRARAQDVPLSIECRGAPMRAPDRGAATRGRSYRSLVMRDLAVHQANRAGAASGDHGVVGDQQQGSAALGAQREHEIDDVAAGATAGVIAGVL